MLLHEACCSSRGHPPLLVCIAAFESLCLQCPQSSASPRKLPLSPYADIVLQLASDDLPGPSSFGGTRRLAPLPAAAHAPGSAAAAAAAQTAAQRRGQLPADAGLVGAVSFDTWQVRAMDAAQFWNV